MTVIFTCVLTVIMKNVMMMKNKNDCDVYLSLTVM